MDTPKQFNFTPDGSIDLTSPDLTIRRRLFLWLLCPHQKDNHHKMIDRWISVLILANLAALVSEHIPAIYTPYATWFHAFDVFSVTIFTVEYLLRLYLAPEDAEFQTSSSPRLRYVRSPFALIDLIAVVPFYLQAFIPLDLRALRLMRLLRILKLFRVLIPAYHEFMAINRGRTFRQKVHALVKSMPWCFQASSGGSCILFLTTSLSFG